MSDIGILQEFLVAAAAAVVAWGIGYYFLLRRLFVVTRLYTRSALSDTGKAISFTILNRGHRSETDINLELDPALSYSLLAASSDDISMSGNNMTVTRLPARSTLEAVLLVEGGEFDSDRVVRLTSKEAGGRALKRLEDVPPSPGAVPLAIAVVLALIGGAAYVAYQTAEQPAIIDPLKLTPSQRAAATALHSAGWENVDDFVKAPMSQAYGTGEFPVRIIPRFRIVDFAALDVVMQNNLSTWLTVTVQLSTPSELSRTDRRRGLISSYIGDEIVLPHSQRTRRMVVYMPRTAPRNACIVRVSVSLQDEHSQIYEVTRFIDLTQTPLKFLSGAKDARPELVRPGLN